MMRLLITLDALPIYAGADADTARRRRRLLHRRRRDADATLA